MSTETTDRYQFTIDDLTLISNLCAEYRTRVEADKSEESLAASPNKQEITARVDALLGYMLDNFDEKAATESDVQSVFEGAAAKATINDIRNLNEGIVPVVGLTILLRGAKAPLDPSKMSNWARFYDIYGERIEKRA